jgi:hypothetical protein
MVQVDVIWSYAFGASFAAAATHQLEAETKPFENRFYVRLLVFLGTFFAPSGLYLLWQFPQWETMQVARTHSDLPAWLVVLFAITNVTQGIVGYYVGYRLSRKGSHYGAHVNWMVAWILFWFVLVAGWDLTGYQRFLYDQSMNQGEPWQPGMHLGTGFFTSRVWISLVVMGALFLPMLRFGIILPLLEGQKEQGLRQGISLIYGATFGVCLLLAIAMYGVVIAAVAAFNGDLLLGYATGIGVSAVLGHFALFRPGMPMHWIAGRMYGGELGRATPKLAKSAPSKRRRRSS